MARVTAKGSSLGLHTRVHVNSRQYWNLSFPKTPSRRQARQNARIRWESAEVVAAGTLSSFKIRLTRW
jgi:hypothetical protein